MSNVKVFVALSGGVDSSVAAALLKESGFDVVGIHMKMWTPRSEQIAVNSEQYGGVCRQQLQDRIDAMRVAATLDIPFQTWDFSEEYRTAVVEYMIREYAAGRTPNPDVMCNRHIKFGLFLQQALAAGADYVATGHYVRRKRREIRDQGLEISKNRTRKLATSLYSLVSARDANKDQSYFLWTLTQRQLQHCLFPISEYTKPEVRELARKFGLPTAEKTDSQGVCFIGQLNMAEFLKGYIPERRGRVLTAAGRMVGEHDGVPFYTIGQRDGLSIGGGMPYYVCAKDTEANTLTVAEGPYDQALFHRELVATDINWISGREPKLPLRCQARIRYRQPLQPCLVSRIPNHVAQVGTRDTRYVICVRFAEPQRAVTPGQSIVFYQAEKMLGGAIIVN